MPDAPHGATLVKIFDRIDNLPDSADRNGGFTKRYSASPDEVIDRLSGQASFCRYDAALDIPVQTLKPDLKK